MPWWVWLLLSWAVIALLGALWVGRLLRTAEQRDWARRGGADRRTRSRDADLDDWVRRGRPERRSSTPEQERVVLSARAAAGYAQPDRRRARRA
jgi:hypothetical protein